VNELHNNHRVAECVNNEMPIPGEKLNIVLMCVVPQMVVVILHVSK
jgi:hypothetical protein